MLLTTLSIYLSFHLRLNNLLGWLNFYLFVYVSVCLNDILSNTNLTINSTNFHPLDIKF